MSRNGFSFLYFDKTQKLQSLLWKEVGNNRTYKGGNTMYVTADGLVISREEYEATLKEPSVRNDK